jgi:hypothetical protein
MRSIEGVVTIVQEGRFQLLDDDGIGHLFLLGLGASADPEQLAPLQRAQSRVRVRYTDHAGLIGHKVTRISVATPGPSRWWRRT